METSVPLPNAISRLLKKDVGADISNTRLRVGHGIEYTRYLTNNRPDPVHAWDILNSNSDLNPAALDTIATEVILNTFDELQTRKIPFEICPTSNFDLVVCDVHPLRDLYQQMPLLISTDNDGIFKIEHTVGDKTYYSVAG